MRNGIGLGAVALALVVLFVAFGSIFTVAQTEQALVLRFGAPVAGRGLITEPGLHYKIPFIESVVKIDNRILDLESPKQEVLAADNQRIDVDAFVRYRITDALRFYQAAGSVRAANNLLASVLNSAVRRVLGEATQTQIVSGERAALMVRIREQVDSEAQKFGVGIVDARIRRADLPREISEKVFSPYAVGTAARGERISRAGQRAIPDDHLAMPTAMSRFCAPMRSARRSRSAVRAMPSARGSSRPLTGWTRISSPSGGPCRPMRMRSAATTRGSSSARAATSSGSFQQPDRSSGSAGSPK